eukprot:SAG31_NODE_45288_length_259_cov_0.968750_1_plen_86_part_11
MKKRLELQFVVYHLSPQDEAVSSGSASVLLHFLVGESSAGAAISCTGQLPSLSAIEAEALALVSSASPTLTAATGEPEDRRWWVAV